MNKAEILNLVLNGGGLLLIAVYLWELAMKARTALRLDGDARMEG